MGSEPSGSARWRASLPQLLVAIAVLSILLRLWALGDRVAHWDEARIAFWSLQYHLTGEWTYHPVFHGPLLFHVERWLFGVRPPTDFTMRLPTAVLGGSLPLAAWLFRDYLENREVLAMAGLLAANPILVYYSRFMRNDILVAGFALVALGAFLRWLATRRLRYAVGVGLGLALAMGSKENALLYLLAWLGAGIVVVAWARARGERNLGSMLHGHENVSRWIGHGVGALVPFLVVSFLIYAPRGSGEGTFGMLLQDSGHLPTVASAALVDPPMQAISFWALGSAQGEYPYHVFFGLLLGLLVVGAAGTLLLAVFGVRRGRDRSIVRFATIWAVLSVIGYPAAADLMAGWTALHVVVPLTIPAAVGFASLLERDDREQISVRSLGRGRPILAIVVIYLFLSVGLTSFVAPGSTYNPIGQPSQMGEGAGETIAEMQTALDTAGPAAEVAYVGPYWESLVHRLPLLWYVERSGADRRFVDSAAALGADPPPVVITHQNRSAAIQQAHSTYECHAHERVPWAGGRPSGLPGSLTICIDSGADDPAA